MNINNALELYSQAFMDDAVTPEELITRVHYREYALSAAAMATSISLFGSAPSNSLEWSLTQAGQVPNPFVLLELGVEFWGDLTDGKVFSQGTYLELKVQDKTYPVIPTSLLPGGGGFLYALDGASAAISAAMQTPAATARQKLIPLGIPKGVDFDIFLRTRGGTITTASRIRVSLHGIERRQVR